MIKPTMGGPSRTTKNHSLVNSKKKPLNNSMKVLFLDFDGVLTSEQHLIRVYRSDFHGEKPKFCPIACSNLRWILEQGDIKIVISSSWRKHKTIEDLQSVLYDHGIINAEVIGKTPLFEGVKRGEEIEAWLKDHPEVTKYAILDDFPDVLDHQRPHLVQTRFDHGLMLKDAMEVCLILNVNAEKIKIYIIDPMFEE